MTTGGTRDGSVLTVKQVADQPSVSSPPWVQDAGGFGVPGGTAPPIRFPAATLVGPQGVIDRGRGSGTPSSRSTSRTSKLSRLTSRAKLYIVGRAMIALDHDAKRLTENAHIRRGRDAVTRAVAELRGRREPEHRDEAAVWRPPDLADLHIVPKDAGVETRREAVQSPELMHGTEPMAGRSRPVPDRTVWVATGPGHRADTMTKSRHRRPGADQEERSAAVVVTGG